MDFHKEVVRTIGMAARVGKLLSIEFGKIGTLVFVNGTLRIQFLQDFASLIRASSPVCIDYVTIFAVTTYSFFPQTKSMEESDRYESPFSISSYSLIIHTNLTIVARNIRDLSPLVSLVRCRLHDPVLLMQTEVFSIYAWLSLLCSHTFRSKEP